MSSKKETKIFIGCLPAETDEEELKSYFLKFCSDLRKFRVKYRSNGICSGYAYFTTEAPNKLLEDLFSQNHFYKGRFLECREYLKGQKQEEFLQILNRKRVYVGNIPEGVDDLELYETFSKFGKVTRAYIGNHYDKEGKIFGFVVMENFSDVPKILEKKWF